mmetsp:Transcript_86110/g.125986  ORF Transcript_86110/g.125986 Transcript_86110/m.125986 type:complete len:327 (-) Transcript_86110:409-1389(-)
MLPILTFPNNLIRSQNLQSSSLLKMKVQYKKFFLEPSKNLKNSTVPENNKLKSKNIVEESSFNKKIEKLISLSSLFFFILFASNPKFFEINGISSVFSSKFSNKSISQKLSQVPVFAVTNATGQPYLANNSNGEQIGLIFFSQEDALLMLKSMQKTHQALEARIYIMGLDKAYRMVISNASPSGIRGNLGQELKMIFRFYPDQKQVKHANNLKKNLNIMDGFKGVPIFIADGLTIRKGNEEIVPIFFTKQDVEESWSKMCKHNPDQPPKPVIRVSNLLELILKMENSPKNFETFGFFPPSESVDFVQRENRKNPSSRIVPGIFQKI